MRVLMRVLWMLLAMVALAGYASGSDPWSVTDQPPVYSPSWLGDHVFYGQGQSATNYPANVRDNSEIVDDLPNSLIGQRVCGVGFYVGTFSGAPWENPNGVCVRIYGGKCPPPLSASSTFYLPWYSLEKTLVWESGNNRCYLCFGCLSVEVSIGAGMSIGFQVDNQNTNLRYYFNMSDDKGGTVYYGECRTYVDWTYAGYPRWTAMAHDIGYFLLNGGCAASGSEDTTWGEIKALFR